MKVTVQHEGGNIQSYPDASQAYIEGPFYCIMFFEGGKRVIHRYPERSLFRVIEEHPKR